MAKDLPNLEAGEGIGLAVRKLGVQERDLRDEGEGRGLTGWYWRRETANGGCTRESLDMFHEKAADDAFSLVVKTK